MFNLFSPTDVIILITKYAATHYVKVLARAAQNLRYSEHGYYDEAEESVFIKKMLSVIPNADNNKIKFLTYVSVFSDYVAMGMCNEKLIKNPKKSLEILLTSGSNTPYLTGQIGMDTEQIFYLLQLINAKTVFIADYGCNSFYDRDNRNIGKSLTEKQEGLAVEISEAVDSYTPSSSVKPPPKKGKRGKKSEKSEKVATPPPPELEPAISMYRKRVGFGKYSRIKKSKKYRKNKTKRREKYVSMFF